jgi:hypothetical protein
MPSLMLNNVSELRKTVCFTMEPNDREDLNFSYTEWCLSLRKTRNGGAYVTHNRESVEQALAGKIN